MDKDETEEEEVVNGGLSGAARHDVTRASYPLPQPLTNRLRRAANAFSAGGDEGSVETESIHAALAELVGNSLEAMDAMYFSRYVYWCIICMCLCVL